MTIEPKELSPERLEEIHKALAYRALPRWNRTAEELAVDDLVQHIAFQEQRIKELEQAIRGEPHSCRCNKNKPYPFSDKAREEWEKLQCNCWKQIV